MGRLLGIIKKAEGVPSGEGLGGEKLAKTKG